MKKCMCVCAAAMACLSAVAADGERDVFGKWRIAVGGAWNSGINGNFKTRNLPVPSGYSVPVGQTKADAERNAAAHRYDGGGYIDPDELDNGFATVNWKLPAVNHTVSGTEPAYLGNGEFALNNSYQEVVGSTVGTTFRGTTDDDCQFGVAFEASRELWIHDEQDAHRWGLDFAFAVSYFFQTDVCEEHGTVTRTDTVQDGILRTTVNDPDGMWRYDNGLDAPVNGMYGHGRAGYSPFSPALRWDSISAPPRDLGGPTHPVASSYGYGSSGDYRELEMLFMLRPWYEITDWWRVFAEGGLGVSWANMSTDFWSPLACASEDFDQWDSYGVVGLGTAFRYGRVDLSVDFLGRFLRDDVAVDGRYVRGSVERANWGFRVMVGVDF